MTTSGLANGIWERHSKAYIPTTTPQYQR